MVKKAKQDNKKNPQQGKWGLAEKTYLLLGIYVACIIASNLMGQKITEILGIEFTVALFIFPLTFLITDVISEVHGRKLAKLFVWIGFACVVFIMLMTMLAVALPTAERSWVKENYAEVFGSSIRIFLASIVAFLLAELNDVWVFNMLKEKTRGRYLWLRNNVSTAAGQAIDTFVFMMVAFYHIPGNILPIVYNTSPKYTILYIIQLSLPYYGLKIAMSLLQTPLCYAGVKWLRGSGKK